MNDALTLVLAWAAGGLLGGVFFGGLWWTIGKGLSSPRPAMWFFGSLLLRMGIAIVGFRLVGDEDWKALVACLLGFVMARLVVTWVTQSRFLNRSQLGEEAEHAPQS